MQLRIIINLLLFVFVIGLTVFLLKTEKPEDKIEPVLVSSIDKEEINRISIHRKDKPTISFKKTEIHWQITEPYPAPAHPNRIKSILDLLSTPSSNQLNIELLDLEQLGLETPSVSLKLNDYSFEFGLTNPLDQSRYLRFDNMAHTIPDQLYYQLTSNETFFIDPKLIRNPDHVISIQTPDYTLNKINDSWKLNPELELPNATPNTIFNGWQQLEANQVEKLEEATSNGLIEITFTDNTNLIFDIVSSDDNLILANKALELQYNISSFMADIIFPKPQPPVTD